MACLAPARASDVEVVPEKGCEGEVGGQYKATLPNVGERLRPSGTELLVAIQECATEEFGWFSYTSGRFLHSSYPELSADCRSPILRTPRTMKDWAC